MNPLLRKGLILLLGAVILVLFIVFTTGNTKTLMIGYTNHTGPLNEKYGINVTGNRSGAHNDSKVWTPRVLCWILTDKSQERRTRRVRDTWTRRCDRTLFFSAESYPEFPMIATGTRPGRKHIASKAKAAWKIIYKQHFHGYDYFMKADPDTYVILDNLRAYLRSRDPTKAEYLGHVFAPKHLNVTYMSGGSGLVISREALRRLVLRSFSRPPECMPDGEGEDYKTARCLRRVGARPVDTRDAEGRETFIVFHPREILNGRIPPWYKKWDIHGSKKGYECCSTRPISFHYIPENDMTMMEYLLFKLKPLNQQENSTSLTVLHFINKHKNKLV